LEKKRGEEPVELAGVWREREEEEEDPCAIYHPTGGFKVRPDWQLESTPSSEVLAVVPPAFPDIPILDNVES
jgi:hypothetical protein